MLAYVEKGILGGIRRAIGAVLRALLIGFIIGVVVAEIGGAALDYQASAATAATVNAGWPHNLFFHIAAIAVGLILGYGFAVTTAFRETLRGLRDVARGLEGDASKVFTTGREDITGIVDSIEHKK